MMLLKALTTIPANVSRNHDPSPLRKQKSISNYETVTKFYREKGSPRNSQHQVGGFD